MPLIEFSICVCGHGRDEHAHGFFSPCEFCDCDDFERDEDAEPADDEDETEEQEERDPVEIPEALAGLMLDDIAVKLGCSVRSMAHNCHGVSLAIVKSGIVGPVSRVARGTCVGVGSQHSWVVVGEDCYDRRAVIVDATLWSYDKSVRDVWVGTLGRHQPHGSGSIWRFGAPPAPVGPAVALTPSQPLPEAAVSFLELCSKTGLDMDGWRFLAHAPVEGWPAAEIIAAMCETAALRHLPPIDIEGMLTDRNPNGLYR